jgi:hypothetical protein
VVIASGAKQSDEVVARAKPVAISRVPSLRSGQGFVAMLLAMTCGWTFYGFIKDEFLLLQKRGKVFPLLMGTQSGKKRKLLAFLWHLKIE